MKKQNKIFFNARAKKSSQMRIQLWEESFEYAEKVIKI